MVTVRQKALGDRRFVRLAQLAQYPGGDDEALGKMTRLWALCAEQQTDTPEVRHIRACLGPRGEEHLVESGLGDDKHRDPSLDEGVIRVRGCDETDWYLSRLEQEARAEAGRARAALATRDAATGRFQPESVKSAIPPSGTPPNPGSTSQEPASSLSLSDLISGSGSGSVSLSPELPDPRTIVRAELGSTLTARQDSRRKLFGTIWGYAGRLHEQLKREGFDPHARNCWAGMPSASSDEVKELLSRIDELTEGDSPNWERAAEVIRNRIDVAAAEARRDKTLRWFIPARMWNPKSFAVAKDMSPEQAAVPRRGGAGPEPRGPRKVVVTEDDNPPLPPSGGRS